MLFRSAAGAIANPATVARTEVVAFTAPPASGNGPKQQLADGRHAFMATAPGSGLGGYSPVACDDHVTVTEYSFTNQHVSVHWDLEGSITSLIDVRAGREVLPVGDRVRLELAPDHPVEYDAWDVEEWTRSLGSPVGGVESVRVIDAGPLVATLEVRRTFGAHGASTMVQQLTVRAGSPRVDLTFHIEWHEDEQLLSLMVPVDIRTREAACDIQYGHVMRPTHASNPWDAAKFEVCAQRYVSLAEPGWGVAVLNDGRYGHSVQEGGVRVSLLRAAKYPDPTQDHGTHRVTISLMPHGPGLNEVLRAAEALNLPLRAVVPGGASALPAPLVHLDGDGVELSAVKAADDGSGDLVVRLYEACGNRTAITVRTPFRIAKADMCNLLEEAQQPIETSDGIVAITLRPFELVTLRLRG